MGRYRFWYLAVCFVGSALIIGFVLGGPFTNKGTQAGLTLPLIAPGNCKNCHGNNYDGANHIEPHDTWSGSMMSQASRDPIFWAALDVANNDVPGIGDYCLRCHVPQGWLNRRSEPPLGTVDGCGLIGNLDISGQSAAQNDLEGVTCHVCHRMMVNPTPPGGEQTVYFENAQYWIDDVDCPVGNPSPEPCRRGPYDYTGPGETPPVHPWAYSAYHESANLCGNCHNVTNPVKTLFAGGVDTGIPFPIERTFKEWQQSNYAMLGQTCQNCHMPDSTANPVNACNLITNNRSGDLPIHRFAGGNAWIPDVLRQAYPALGLDTQLQATRNAALDMLQNQSAQLDITVPSQAVLGGSLGVQIQVTNLTGHKLPTGYPEGRRIWINVQARDGVNDLIWESGAYNSLSGVLTEDAAIKVYETKPGVWNFNGSSTCDIADGVGSSIFHFALNNCIVADNRIPPLGFTGMNDIETRPVGYTYPETSPGSGVLVNYDVTSYSIPVPANAVSPLTVTATLRYQTTSKEYVEFLLDEATTHSFPDDCIDRSTGPETRNRAEILHDMWNTYGKSPPVNMTSDAGAATLLAPTPGEASGATQMLVTSYNKTTGDIGLSYQPACSATNHTVYAGSLASVSAMTFANQTCALGASGTATINLGSGDAFWVIVGHNGVREGSYGTNSSGTERPENTTLPTCNYPQDLALRCDP